MGVSGTMSIEANLSKSDTLPTPCMNYVQSWRVTLSVLARKFIEVCQGVMLSFYLLKQRINLRLINH